ncbi:DNA gyrase inhibitor GyrI [Paenibacillus harenae]|nr:DNA gyrase inhibitor GyrI [Paenibacillus harenae]
MGFEVEELDAVPYGAAGKRIPPLTYAMATHVGPPAETLGQTLDYVYGEWFLNSTYQTGHLRLSPISVIEYYDKRCSLTPPEMDIFVPIKLPSDNRITEVAPFKAAFYRAVGNDAAKLKYEAFDVMINWVEKHRHAGKDYEGGMFAVADGVHHFLEKDWATFMKWLEQHPEYKTTGGCYEEFLIDNGKVDYYTTLQFYEKVEKR